MHGDELARATGKFSKLPQPEHVESAARAPFTWLKPTPRFWDSGPAFREFPTSPATLGRLGSLEVRLAQNKRDIKRAQKLRFHVFYENGTAVADAITMLARRDKDGFDAICDHLLVIDHAARPSLSGKQPVVGTYRLLRQDVASSHGGFYTEDEFDISGLIDRHRALRFLEL